MSKELKGCPLCGEKTRIVRGGLLDSTWYIECNQLDHDIVVRSSEDSKVAVAIWNHRPDPTKDALVAALKAVRKVIEDCDDAWWIKCPDKGGFDTDEIDAALSGVEE